MLHAAVYVPLPCVAHLPALCTGNNKWGGYFIFNDTSTLTTITGKPGALYKASRVVHTLSGTCRDASRAWAKGIGCRVPRG